MSELLPCPFCGADAKQESATLVRNTYHWVRCANQLCKVIPSAMQCLREVDAIAAWNRRQPISERELIEVIKTTLAREHFAGKDFNP